MNKANYYRERSKLLRGQAALTADPELKDALHQIAQKYENLAVEAGKNKRTAKVDNSPGKSGSKNNRSD